MLVQKPYMERRSYATFKKHWPDKKLLVTSPQISFEAYPTPEISLEKVILRGAVWFNRGGAIGFILLGITVGFFPSILRLI